MTSCRVNFAFAALLALTLPAAAQDQPAATGAPTPLAPPPTSSSDDQAPAAGDAPVEFRPGILGAPVQTTVAPLNGPVDGPPVGTLEEAQGGLGASMWVNASRDTIEDLLTRVPLVSADPFARSLSRRVVLTPSEAPVGNAKRALVAIRIEKLLQGGLIEDAGTIAAALKLDNDPDFARVQAEALLYAGRDQEVCSDLTATRLTAPDPFWLELRIYCFEAGGDHDSAELARAALDGIGDKDPAFELLASDVLTGAKKTVKDIDHPTALHIYLLRKAGFAIPGAIAARLGTAANVLAARDPRNSPADRLAAAARIAATGALSPAEQLAILNAQEIPAKDLANAVDTASKLPFLPAEGLLRRAALLESRPPARLDLLLAALAHPERLPQAAMLQADVAVAVKPDATVARGRSAVARALVLAGKTDAASAWYAGAADDADTNAFRILADIAAPTAQRDAAAQAAYAWFATNAAPQQAPDARAALALGLADVLGKPMPPQAKALASTLEAAHWDGPAQRRPASGDIRKLEQAAAQPGRKGEVALRVLDIVGADGPHDLPADVTIECARILVAAGLAGEARQLAVEALAAP